MALAAGTRLGSYEIHSLIGAGGMGEVYKARDTRLGRTVAIKILPPDVAINADRHRRFEQESRAASALNHPHICVLHDIGSDAGIDYLVMEYLDGQTLAQRLAKVPLPVAQALEYAVQIADALAAAHRAGIVHRDLKPGNVMITKSGAKLLDFGLARFTETSSGATGLSATLTASATIVGTVPYMAPEQVQGLTTDARTDLFAFGAVLYEMLTGKRAFDGDSAASVTASILDREPPPISSLQPLAPSSLERVVRKCLAKDPDARWQTAADLRDELQWIAGPREGSDALVDTHARASRFNRRTSLVAGGCVLAVLLLVVATLAWISERTPAPLAGLVQRYELSVAPADGLRGPDERELTMMAGRPSRLALAVSPDGRWLVFSGYQTGRQGLYLRDMVTGDIRPIANTDGAEGPFFKPDGSRVGFWARGAIRSVDLSGGPAELICETEALWGAAWSDDDTIIFARRVGPLWRVAARGGAVQPETKLGANEVSHLHPHLLPDGAVVFTVAGPGPGRIVAEDRRTRRRVDLVKGDSARGDPEDARFVAPGYLIYARRGALEAVGFDPRRPVVTGSPVTLLADIMQSEGGGSADLNSGVMQAVVSSAGTLFYVAGGIAPLIPSRLVWRDLAGDREILRTLPDMVDRVRISPDGGRILFTSYTSAYSRGQIYILDVGAGMTTAVTPQRGEAAGVIWKPAGGLTLQYTLSPSFDANPVFNLFAMPEDGSAAPDRLMPPDDRGEVPQCWTRDGRTILYTRGFAGAQELWKWDSVAKRADRVVTTDNNVGAAQLSPDGRWLAYEEGHNRATATQSPAGYQLYVRGFAPPGGPVRVSNGYGASPLWSPDGRTLFYTRRSDDGTKTMIAVDMADGRPVAGKPRRELFTGQWAIITPGRSYDLSPDGKRFLLIEDDPATPQNVSRINVVVNWTEELRAHVRPGR